jgi:hypothetical protein
MLECRGEELLNKRCYRRWFGLASGALTGLLYGSVSQLINLVFIPGVPLYHPPFGLLLNILTALGIGVLVGVATAWSDHPAKGIFSASLVGAAFLIAATMLTGDTGQQMLAQKILSLFFFTLPIIATMVPFTALFRWILNDQQDQLDIPFLSWARLRGLALLLVLATGVGAFSLTKPAARQVLPQAHQLIQQGLGAAGPADLPPSLQPPDVVDFLGWAVRSYTLEWTQKDINRFSIARPASALGKESVIIARFNNGKLLACMYWDANTAPECRGFDRMPPKR